MMRMGRAGRDVADFAAKWIEETANGKSYAKAGAMTSVIPSKARGKESNRAVYTEATHTKICGGPEMKIAIILIGLIVQVNQPRSFDNTAVLIYEEHHQPLLIIPLQSIKNPDDPWVKQWITGSNVEINIRGADVRLKGTRGVFCGLHDDFLAGSPALRTLAPACKLRSEVKKRQPVKGELAAYFDFRGGEIMAKGYLPFMISFKEGEACAVCAVRYEAKIRGDHVTLVYTKSIEQPNLPPTVETHEILVAGGPVGSIPTITVSNTPPIGMAAHSKLAFNIYADHCATGIPPVSHTKCKKPQCDQLTAKPDALDQHAEVHFPGDDCTIDRHP